MKYVKKIFFELLLVIIPVVGIYKFYEFDLSKYTSIFILGLLIFFQYFFEKFLKNHEKNKLIYFLAISYALFYVFGTIIDRNASNNFYYLFQRAELKNTILYIYSFTIFSLYILNGILEILPKLKGKDKNKLNKKYYFAMFLLLFLSYVPYLYALYPGLLSPDSMTQIGQAVGTWELSNHHPILHTLFIKFCFLIGGIFGDITAKVVTYSIIQMLLQSLCFAYCLYFIGENSNNKKMLGILFIFYLLNPLFGFYSITMWKDVLFGNFMLIAMIQVYKFCYYQNLSKIDLALTIISFLLVSLFRSNGVIIALVMSFILFIAFKEKRKKAIFIFIIPSVLGIIIVGPVYNFLGIKKGNLVESLSIPLEQISGTVARDLEIPKEDKDYINELVGEETIKNNYSILSIDGIKFNSNFNNDFLEKNKMEFFKVWFNLLKKYPLIYVDIYLKSTYGFWYIESEGYTAHIWQIDSNEFGLKTKENSLTNKLFIFHNKLLSTPVIKYCVKPAPYFLVLLFALCLVIMKKSFKNNIALLLPFIMWGTIMIASPVNYQARYVYSLFTTFPMVIFMISQLFNMKNERRKM